ncbi:MAG: hypothetical protein H6739_16315 [Alphaproteobacteria bacterium]|nr:hypothetical protein [Alphaproteobacteria bacterium]
MSELTIDERLERTQWDPFWIDDDVEVVDRPELMFLSCPRDVPYLNHVVRVRAEPARVAEVVAEVVAAHAGRTSQWMVTPQSRSEALLDALKAAGYRRGHTHNACSLDVTGVSDWCASGITVRRVDTMDALRDAIQVRSRGFDMDEHETEDTLRRALRFCADPGGRVHRFVAYDDATGAPLSTGGMNWYPDLALAFLWGGCTVPAGRGRGAYRSVVFARAAQVRALGGERMGLYGRVNTSWPILERLGFTRHGEMVHWFRVG